MEKSIVFAGFGGQGVLTAGLILANVANDCGKQVLWMPAYGGQMRGGKSYSLVKFDDQPICHPDIESLDILVAMNQPSLEEFSRYSADDGLILINSDTVPDKIILDLPGRTILRAPFASMARDVQNPKGANIAALGYLLKITSFFDYSVFEEGMLRYFAGKGKDSFASINAAALKKGYDNAIITGAE